MAENHQRDPRQRLRCVNLTEDKYPERDSVDQAGVIQDRILDHKHTGKGDRVEEPLRAPDLFAQDEHADERGKDRREVGNCDRGRERDVLHRDEEGEERQRAERAAGNEQRIVIPLPIGAGARNAHEADGGGNETAKEHNFHRRNPIELLHKHVHDGERERRQEHVGDGSAEQAR